MVAPSQNDFNYIFISASSAHSLKDRGSNSATKFFLKREHQLRFLAIIVLIQCSKTLKCPDVRISLCNHLNNLLDYSQVDLERLIQFLIRFETLFTLLMLAL